MPDNASTLRTAAAVMVGIVALVVLLVMGAAFFAPLAVGAILALLLKPPVRALQRVGLPAPIGATLVILGVIALLVGFGASVAEPAHEAIDRLPDIFSRAQAQIGRLVEPFERGPVPVAGASPKDAAAAIATALPATMPTTAPTTAPAAGPSNAELRSLASPAFTIFGGVTQVAGITAEILVVALLLLAGNGRFERKLATMLKSPEQRAAAADVIEKSESVITRYVYVTAVINLGQGAIVGVVMWWLGLPLPWLWVGLTFVFEFVPYLGAAAMVVLLGACGLATLNSVGHALLAPALYLVITNLQNNLVSPWAYGRRLSLNPVAVLIGVLFWWYVWGIPGAFIAVPLLAITRLACERTTLLQPVAEFLAE